MRVDICLRQSGRVFAPLGLAWLALALRLYRLTYQSLWRDEVDTLRFATRSLPDVLKTFGRPGENGPLFFLSMRPWLALAGQSEFALRFPAVLAGALAVPIAYTLVCRLAGPRPALVAALLSATAPYLVWYGQEGRMYAVLTVLVPLSLWLAVAAAQRGKWWRWVLLYVITSLSFYTHVLAALVVPVQFLWLLLVPAGRLPPRSYGGLRRRLPLAVAYLGALVIPYLPMIWWQATLWLSPTFETGHPFVSLPTILQVLMVTYAAGVMPVKAPIILLPFMLALLAGIGLRSPTAKAGPVPLGQALSIVSPGQALPQTARDSAEIPPGQVSADPPGAEPTLAEPTSSCRNESLGRWRPVVLLLVWLFLPPVAVYGVSMGMPIFTDRYLIWVMPAALALMALGVVALVRVWSPLGWATLGAILVLNLGAVRAQTAQPIKADFRAAAEFVLAHRHPDDVLMFQIPYARYGFAYYVARLAGLPDETFDPSATLGIAWRDGPYTNDGMSESGLAERMARETTGVDAIWLIASEASLWDTRSLTKAWLEEHGRVTDHADFARVSVTRYELTR